jgi:hypothetical protein
MNKIKVVLIGGAIALFGGCKPHIEGELGELTDKVKGLDGTWELEQFIQQDPNNPVLEERDLSELYLVDGVTPLRLTLNISDRSFAVENTVGKNFFGTSGTWELDDNIAPSNITLNGVTDTLTADLAAMVQENSTNMGLKYIRQCSDGYKNVIYKFNFKRVD